MNKQLCKKCFLRASIAVFVFLSLFVFAAEDAAQNGSIATVRSITNDLTNFSGKSFPVFVRECKGWAEAREDGTIVIDLKIAREQKEIVAFLLAHEWGHLVLGHVEKNTEHRKQDVKRGNKQHNATDYQTNLINPKELGVAMFSREHEWEADRYTVKFMAHKGYAVELFVKFLLAAADDQRLHYGLHTHDTKEVRAKCIRSEYKKKLQSQKSQKPGPNKTQ